MSMQLVPVSPGAISPTVKIALPLSLSLNVTAPVPQLAFVTVEVVNTADVDDAIVKPTASIPKTTAAHGLRRRARPAPLGPVVSTLGSSAGSRIVLSRPRGRLFSRAAAAGAPRPSRSPTARPARPGASAPRRHRRHRRPARRRGRTAGPAPGTATRA